MGIESDKNIVKINELVDRYNSKMIMWDNHKIDLYVCEIDMMDCDIELKKLGIVIDCMGKPHLMTETLKEKKIES